jgi:hypothetical protein
MCVVDRFHTLAQVTLSTIPFRKTLFYLLARYVTINMGGVFGLCTYGSSSREWWHVRATIREVLRLTRANMLLKTPNMNLVYTAAIIVCWACMVMRAVKKLVVLYVSLGVDGYRTRVRLADLQRHYIYNALYYLMLIYDLWHHQYIFLDYGSSGRYSTYL